MKMTNEEYKAFVESRMPPSPLVKDILLAFVIGGAICCVGQGFMELFAFFGLSREDTSTAVSIVMIFLGALSTGLGFYDDLAKYGGAGTLVPITGFANAVVSPALEFKTEGMILGTAAKMFTIAGPVIVYGIGSSVIYGLICAMLA